MIKKKETDPQQLPEEFTDFHPTISVKSPGRINLIGEHTDYNSGYVLPTAIDKHVTLHFSENSTNSLARIYSKTYGKGFSFDLKKVSRSEQSWKNYILGVVNEIQKLEKDVTGFDCVIESNVPVGAGISSSAALECGFAFGLNKLFDLGISRETIAEISRNAEHNYVGTKCGIMDQYASVLSKEGNLILLDCKTMEPFYIPAQFEGYKLLLLNTRVSHSLAESEYNTRREECEEVVRRVREKFPEVTSIRDINFVMLKEAKSELSPELFERASYVLEENERVLDTVRALKEKDLNRVGELLYASHEGLKDKYEVSCKELDFLVDFSRDFDHVLGSRMMGGGFGGCTINLIREDYVDEYVSKATEAYYQHFDIILEAIPVRPAGGTNLVENS